MQCGCLLIHGWTGAPFEMEPLVEPLQSAGIVPRLVTLPGHDTSFEEFQATFFEDWVRGAEEAYVSFAQEVDKVVVCGLSMGGTLALHLAQRYDVAGVITLASPVYVYRLFPPEMKDWRLPLVRLLRHVRPIWPSPPRSEESQMIAPWRGYDSATSLPQLWSLMEGARRVGGELDKVTAPLLAAHAPTDKTAPSGNLWKILNGVSSEVRQGELIPIKERKTAHHVITTHQETSEKVANMVVEFIRNRCFCIQNCKK